MIALEICSGGNHSADAVHTYARVAVSSIVNARGNLLSSRSCPLARENVLAVFLRSCLFALVARDLRMESVRSRVACFSQLLC